MHKPIMINEIIRILNIKKNGIYIDATFGYGGYSKALLNCSIKINLFIIDSDPKSIKHAIQSFFKKNKIKIFYGSFRNLKNICHKKNILGKVDGIILDLGISLYQILDISRGFGLRNNGALDMRINPYHGIPINIWLNNANYNDILHVLFFFKNKEDNYKIARRIHDEFKIHTIAFTKQLSIIILKYVEIKKKYCHPAKKIFLSLRNFVNNESDDLEILLKSITRILIKNGKLICLSFNSIEKNIFKKFYKTSNEIKFIKKYIPKYIELNYNPTSRSSIMYILEKI